MSNQKYNKHILMKNTVILCFFQKKLKSFLKGGCVDLP